MGMSEKILIKSHFTFTQKYDNNSFNHVFILSESSKIFLFNLKSNKIILRWRFVDYKKIHSIYISHQDLYIIIKISFQNLLVWSIERGICINSLQILNLKKFIGFSSNDN